jgi:hypothetical protein
LAQRGWQRKFEDPISLPDGRALVRLHDAATYITALPKTECALPEWTECALPEWQAAIAALMLVVEQNGPTMFALISVMRALNRGHVCVFNSYFAKILTGAGVC